MAQIFGIEKVWSMIEGIGMFFMFMKIQFLLNLMFTTIEESMKPVI